MIYLVNWQDFPTKHSSAIVIVKNKVFSWYNERHAQPISRGYQNITYLSPVHMYNKYYKYYDNGLPVLEIKQVKSLLTLNFCNGLQKSDQQNNSKYCHLEIPK